MKKLIIAAAGKKGSGKTTFCNQAVAHLVNTVGDRSFRVDEDGILRDKNSNDYYGFFAKKISFAGPLKRFCTDTLGLTNQQVYGSEDDKNTVTNVPWPRRRDECSAMMTAREVMQYFGNLMRGWFPHIWVNAWHRHTMIGRESLVVVDDVRFPNELTAIRNRALEDDTVAKIVRLTRNVTDRDDDISETALDKVPDSCFDLVLPAFDTVEQQTRYLAPIFDNWMYPLGAI